MPAAPVDTSVILSPEQIGALIIANGKWGPGGTESKIVAFLDEAIAIALAESSGNPMARNGVHAGLYQIATDVHADKIAGRNIYDPVVNVDVARLVWEAAGNSFSPWTKFEGQPPAYLKFLGHGQTVYDAAKKGKTKSGNSWVTGVIDLIPVAGPWIDGFIHPSHNPATVAVNAAKDTANSLGGAVSTVLAWLAEAGMVIGATLLAIVLFALGVWFLISETKAGDKIKSAGKDAAMAAAL